MEGQIHGYMRISTNKDTQTTERQKITLNSYAEQHGFEFEKLWEEQISGTVNTANRPVYKDLYKVLRKGDILVLTDIDRLGRDADNVIMELKMLKAKGVRVIVLDTPYLNDWNLKDSDNYAMAIDMFITFKAHIAQQERKKISERVTQGMKAAKENPKEGKKAIGRPKSEDTAFYRNEFIPKYIKYLEGKHGQVSKAEFARDTLRIGRTTFYKYIELYERDLEKQKAEANGKVYQPAKIPDVLQVLRDHIRIEQDN